jgi:hypothetical protein
MEMDRNVNTDGKGKYALILLRKIFGNWGSPSVLADAIKKDPELVDYGIAGGEDEFFVIRLNDKQTRLMIIKLICWFWGHDFISKTAKKDQVEGFHLVECSVSSFCFRCGCKNKDYVE